MDGKCNETEVENINNSFKESGESEKAKCGSPVFRCVTQTKPVRESFLDSSDYDIPSYQVNQSLRSRASSKYESERGDSILPFSPIFTPIPVATVPQFQPPSIHTLSTVCKFTDKTVRNKGDSNKNDVFKPGGIFDSLGMLDKDVSWVSSMASPTPKLIPGSEFNTVEKATFLPEVNFQSIQPRALFSPTFDDDFGCQPITFTSESDDDESYKSNIRLSDVCTTLKLLEVRSLDQVSNNSDKKTILEDRVISPVIITKKKTESAKKKNKKKGVLVLSPKKDKYEFSVGESLKIVEPDDVKSNDVSNFSEDDLFQSISFSGIDELCKTLVSEKSDSTLMFIECDKTLVNNITTKPKRILKKFYSTKAPTTVHAVSSLKNLYARAFVQDDNGFNTCKIKQCFTDQGIVRFDVLSKDSSTKRLHSDVTDQKDESTMKKFKKGDNWESFEECISESQLNVIDDKMIETVEKLEKTLASRKEVEDVSKGSAQDKSQVGNTETEKDVVQLPAFKTASGLNISVSEKALHKAKDLLKDCDENLESFVSEESDQQYPTRDFVGFSTCSGKEIKISDEALAKAKIFMMKCEASFQQDCDGKPKCDEDAVGDCGNSKVVLEGSDQQEESLKMKGTSSGKLTKVSAEKAKTLMLESNNEYLSDVPSTSTCQSLSKVVVKDIFEGFSTGSGKSIQVSAKAMEKAKMFMKECEKEFNESYKPSAGKDETKTENQTKDFDIPVVGFSTALGKKVEISEEALKKGKMLMKECEKEFSETYKSKISKVEPREVEKVEVSCEAPEKAKPLCAQTVETNIPESSKLFPVTSAAEPVGIEELDDWDEIIPSWLHVYTTSPPKSPEISPIRHQEPYVENILKNPVLGPSDRFYGKQKTPKLEDNKSRKVSAKRTLSIDFSVPFKKIKVEDTKSVCVNVKEGRARAREEQERIVKEKQKVKPVEGSHLRKKRTEKQISWMDAVGKSSPEAYSDDYLRSLGVKEDVLSVNVENSMKFRFNGEQYFGLPDCLENTTGFPTPDGSFLILDDDNKLGVEEIKRGFLATPGVQPNLLPSRWVENHYKWIVWKLSHYERSFPLSFGGKSLTPNQVMLQLKYRYDREIDRNERSALKKILERDDSSVKRLVLCVCGVKKVTVNDTTGYELEVTDGWYSCPARGDQAMQRMIEEGKLRIGVKILTQGAILVGCEQGVSPLEVGGNVYLRLSTNSTRRARWDTKLGFQKNPENFPISIGSILPQGGSISRIDVIVVRIYPIVYTEKIDGHHVTRNRRGEEKAEAEYRRLQEQRIEAIYNEVQSEMRKSGKEKLLEDPFENVSSEGRNVFSNEESRKLAEKVEKKLEEEKLKKRVVSQVLKVKIVDFRKPDYNNPAVLSVWNPNEDWSCVLIEGKVVSIMNVTISNSRMYKPLQINTTRQTHFRPIGKNVKYPARCLTPLRNVSSKVCPVFEEIDVVGMVILIRDVSYGSRLSQVVYLTDLEMNFVGIVFWGSCKDFGWENVLRVKSIVACSNLQWKKNYSPQDVPSVYVNESSVFTENPKQTYLREEIERLKQNLPQDIPDFLLKCEEDLTTKLEDSKWRTNTSKNSSNDSSLRDCSKVSGFESKPTASSTPIKPFKTNPDTVEPSPIQKRIEKLQCYGEPSPLIPLLIRNNMKRRFKRNK